MIGNQKKKKNKTKMKKVKNLTDFDPINEAGNIEGNILLCTTSSNLGYKQYSRWSTYTIGTASAGTGRQAPKASPNEYFFVKVATGGRKWVEGPIVLANAMWGTLPGTNNKFNDGGSSTQVRVEKSKLINDGFLAKLLLTEEVHAVLGKPYFLDGKETGLLNMAGTSETASEGEFVVTGANFGLSRSMKEPVMFLKSKSKDEYFNAPLSILKGFSNELTNDQRVVIAEWFAGQLGKAQIEVSGDKFSISQWYIKANQVKGFPNAFSAGPFVNKKQCDDVLKSIEKLNVYSLFDPKAATIETTYSRTTLDLDALISWCRTIGIKTTMKELLVLRRGAVSAQKFGI